MLSGSTPLDMTPKKTKKNSGSNQKICVHSKIHPKIVSKMIPKDQSVMLNCWYIYFPLKVVYFSTKDEETTLDVGDSENRLRLSANSEQNINAFLIDFSGFSNFKKLGDFTLTTVLLQAPNLRCIVQIKLTFDKIIYASGWIIERKLWRLFVKGVQSF